MGHNEQNLRAYDGVEDLLTYTSKEAVDQYRLERLEFASGAVAFLEKMLNGRKQISVLDIGSGSSCLLYALDNKGILSKGVGIEISKSRHDFAQQWKREGEYHRVENINKDVRDVSFEKTQFDVCAILDSTFTYFYPVDAQMPMQILERAYQALGNGGWLVMEMASFIDTKRLCKDSGVYYKWAELPETNKFLYSLYKVEHSPEEDVMRSESRYIYRGKVGESRKIEYSKVYTPEALEKMLIEAGFSKPDFYDGYNNRAYDPKSSSRLLLSCRKDR